MKRGDVVYMLDAWMKNPVRGKVVQIWPQDGAITIEDDHGIRHTTSDQRRFIFRDLMARVVPGAWLSTKS